ncbi:MAG: hypothetical protein LBT41_01815 [Candidatus Methanoplasma sp.]|jgi:hypothetical protein|nr:hypothetical protein [Candidatus Methanoplasma sp.]
MAAFEEVHDVMPRASFIALVAILAATDAFILLCTAIDDIGTELWMFGSSTVIFAAVILACFFVKLKISVDNDEIRITLIKRYTYRTSDVIGFKIGDIDIIRNYSGWGMRGVKFKNFISAGYERGISLKLLGKRVVTFSLEDPEAFAALLPEDG